MKTLFLVAISCMIAGAAQSQFSSLPLDSQVPMMEVKMKDISGRDVSLRDAVQKNGLLVMFSCNTCPYVKKNQERTLQLAALARQHQVGVILLNSNEGGRDEGDSYADMQEYSKGQGYNFFYTVDTDSRMANAFGASRTPEIYLFDASGKLQYKGAIDDNPSNGNNVKRNHAREAITEMAAGKAVSVRESRSVGCGIKRN
jgi:hypothetical protein